MKTLKNTKKSTVRGPRKALIFVCIIVAAGVTVAALEATNKTHFFHARKAVSGVIPSTPRTTATAPPTTSGDKTTESVPSSQNSSSPEDQKQGDTTTTPVPDGTPPITPSGNFISNHSPNLDGSPAPASVQSVCNTSPGATCRIEFKNADGVIKKLATQKTDGNGATYWNWDVNKAGFTVGSWQITVVAELNGQMATAQDPHDLEVGP